MKNSIIILLAFLLYLTGFSQNSSFGNSGRFTPVIKKEKLSTARFINDVMPEFGRYFSLPYNDRVMLDQRRILVYPQGDFYPQENFNYYIDYVSVEIMAICNGIALTSQSSNDILTPEQIEIINNTDLGTDINIKVKFRFKDQAIDNLESGNALKEGKYTVTVVPASEALYPGGFEQITEYLTENVMNNISEKKASDKIQQAVVRFTVDEEGQIVNAEISRTSTDPKIDELLLDATKRMSKWTPAENSKGLKVRQVFSIPLGSIGC